MSRGVSHTTYLYGKGFSRIRTSLRPDKVLGSDCHHEPYQGYPIRREDSCCVGVRSVQRRQPHTLPVLFSSFSGTSCWECSDYPAYDVPTQHWQKVASWHQHPTGSSVFPSIFHMKRHHGFSTGPGGPVLVRSVSTLTTGRS